MDGNFRPRRGAVIDVKRRRYVVGEHPFHQNCSQKINGRNEVQLIVLGIRWMKDRR
jgi:hypothetical protein